MRKQILFIAGAALVLATGCGGTEEDYEIGQAGQGLYNGGGTTLGYTCTTTLDGTTCECNSGVQNPFDEDTCYGLDQHCRDHGTKPDCTSTPGKCTCSYSSDLAPQPPLIRFLPVKTATQAVQ